MQAIVMVQVRNAVHALLRRMVQQRVAAEHADLPVPVAIQRPARNVYQTAYIAQQTVQNSVPDVRHRFVQTTDGQTAQHALRPRFAVAEAVSHAVQIKWSVVIHVYATRITATFQAHA